MEEQKTIKTFDEFTNLYELSKTLRFELKPVGKTDDLIKKQLVFPKDKLLDDNYHKIKYYLDCLHRKFIKEALKKTRMDLNNYYQKFLNLKKDNQKSINDDFRKEEDNLRQIIIKEFRETAEQWKNSYKDKGIGLKSNGDKIIEILFEKENLKILKEEFKEKPANDKDAPDIEFFNSFKNKKENLFGSFEGFTTYFDNFNNSRRNFYSEDAKDTAVANRIINENLKRFCSNIKAFNDKKNNYEKIGLSTEEMEVFKLEYYNNCLTQEGIKKYNDIIGRKSKKENEGEKGINQKINEYYQQTKEKLPLFKKLDRQIMGERERGDRFIEITNDTQAFEILKGFLEENNKKIEQAKYLFMDFVDSQLSNNEKYDIDKIYLKRPAINTISRKFFGENFIYFENALPHKETSSGEEKYKLDDFISIQQIKNTLLGQKSELPKNWKCLNDIKMKSEDLFNEVYKNKNLFSENNWHTFLKVWQYEFEKLLIDKQEKEQKIEKEIISKGSLDKARLICQEKSVDGKPIDINEISIIKMYADSVLSIFQIMKYFALEKGRKREIDLERDDKFYDTFDAYYYDYKINDYYNEFRNYLTKKDFLGRLLFPAENDKREYRHPFSKRKLDGAEKIKLNFEISHDHKWNFLTFLFKKNGEYYVGVAKKGKNIKFHEDKNGINFEKMRYKQLKFKTLAGKGYIRDFGKSYGLQAYDLTIDKFKQWLNENNFIIENINDEIKKERNRKNGMNVYKIQKLIDKQLPENIKNNFQKISFNFIKEADQFVINNLKVLIKKQYLNDYPLLDKTLEEKYQSRKDFSNCVEELLTKSYSAKFFYIKEDVIELNEKGDLYLFQINNKDLRNSGASNLHTEYFRFLFNQSSPVILKLNSEIKLFFRPQIDDLPIYEKNGKKVTFIDKRDGNKEKNVLQNRRYGQDKCFLHLSCVQNFGKQKVKHDEKSIKGFAKRFNADINGMILKNNFNILGIDRGENNLAYYSIIDQNGRIIESDSFNRIEIKDKDGKVIKTVNYLELLEKKAGDRDVARKNWQTIENIKELKKGYVSQVIRKICDLILEHNAIVVFEDLSGGFKRSRMKIEKQIYQKLELALIKKLNYLVNKNAKEGEPGHYLKAYQLTSPIATYENVGKQTGIIFYTQAGYTSKTCPVCGYRKNIGYAFYFETEEKAIDIISKLRRFEYNNLKDCFEIEYLLSNFAIENNSKKEKNKKNELYAILEKKDKFVISSKNIIRYKWHNKQTERAKTLNKGEEYISNEIERQTAKGIVKKYDITKCLIGLFEINGIDFKNGDFPTCTTRFFEKIFLLKYNKICQKKLFLSY